MSAVVNNKNIVIENPYIKKEFILKRGRISSFSIENKVSCRTLVADKGCEEFEIFLKGAGLFRKKSIRASRLKIIDAKAGYKEKLTELRIAFAPFSFKGSSVSVTEVYELSDDDRFFRKHLELSFNKIGSKQVTLDRINFEKISFESKLMHWSIPEQKKSHISGLALTLGQPVYLDSLFFGCEFPLTRNTIRRSATYVEYYSGKSLTELIKNGTYRSYSYVAGVADGCLFAQVQKAFFEYIRTISKPCRLRRQYNSWYDHMLNITTDNITSSFLEIEKGLTKSGEPPVDSYVADDGWNDYTKGFWNFNEKFPDGLSPFARLTESFGSRFGLWLGPRGGYTNDTPKFARQIEKAGNGYYNKQSRDICVASDKYTEKTGELLLDFMKTYRLNYFKLDGFAQHPCKNRNHDHMTGGYKDMYFYTDVWEKWLKVFESLNNEAAENFWINLTCYAPPSAWYLQWVNSVWMQVSNDHGFIGKKGSVSDKDGLLSYRDETYFDFYKSRQFQFPQRSLYNHDPIYGAEAKVNMSDEDFRSYLFTMAARGTAFWELYYSHSLMNEAKWRINHGALRFIDKNMSVLSHSVIFGERPSQSKCYGYACFADDEAILCIRNSGKTPQNFSVRLDENIGVSSQFTPKSVCTVLPYTIGKLNGQYGYGDVFEAFLAPYESRIYHFGKKPETLKVEYLHPVNENTIEISFNTVVGIENINCPENTLVKAQLLEDYMSVRLTFAERFAESNHLTIRGIGDILGGRWSAPADFDYNENGLVISSVKGRSGFSIKATLDEGYNRILMIQDEEISLEIDEEGYVKFTVSGESLRSSSTVLDTVQIVAVRERNGVMKLYFDGELNSGRPSSNTYLKGENLICFDKVKVYDRAFSYDEV